MIDLRYRKGKIYTIRSHLTDRVYVGSTITTLSRRIGKHRSDYKVYKNGKGSKVMVYDLFDQDPNCYIELHEYYPCNNKEELNKREGQVMRKLNYVNRCIAGRTKQEYKKQYRKQKYNCECGSTVGINDKARHFKSKKHRKWVLNAHNCFNHL